MTRNARYLTLFTGKRFFLSPQCFLVPTMPRKVFDNFVNNSAATYKPRQKSSGVKMTAEATREGWSQDKGSNEKYRYIVYVVLGAGRTEETGDDCLTATSRTHWTSDVPSRVDLQYTYTQQPKRIQVYRYRCLTPLNITQMISDQNVDVDVEDVPAQAKCLFARFSSITDDQQYDINVTINELLVFSARHAICACHAYTTNVTSIRSGFFNSQLISR